MNKISTILFLFIFSIFSFASAQDNYSLSFDGVDDYVDMSGNDDFNFGTGDFTIEHWYKSGETSGHFCNSMRKYGTTNNYYDLTINVDGTGLPQFHFANGSGQDYNAVGNIRVDDNQWHHLCGVRDGNVIKLYIDGELSGSTNIPDGANADNSGSMTIGAQACGHTDYTVNNIDEVSIWNIAQTQEQVQSYMNTPLTGDETGLVGYWNFNDGEGTTLIDLSGSGNHGTIYGATWSDDGALVDPQDTIATITLSEVDTYIFPGYIGDTVFIAVNADLGDIDLYSSEMHFTGFQGVLGFEGIVTEGTPTGDSDWNVIFNEQVDTLIIAHYGSDAIHQGGILFYLKFSVSDILPESIVPIELIHVELNEKEGFIEVIDGSVSIGHLFHIGITETVGIPGDTVSISVHANLWQHHSFEITLSGLEGGNISAVAVDTAGTILDSDWMWSYSITDSGSVIVMAESGVTTASDNGVLFNVHFAIDIESLEGFNPLFITSATFSGEDNQFETDHGGVVVSGLGDVSMDGRVGAYDAGLILLHLVGLESFNNDQIAIGNVTYDNSLSALDAVIILDYVVGLVEELPFDGSSMAADGSFVISGGSINPGEIFQMPIMLTDGSDIRSFELEFGYDPESLIYQSIFWNTDVMPDLQIIDNQAEGIVRVSAAGMGSLSPGGLTLGWIEFQLDDLFNDYQTNVMISRSRVNERVEEVDGSIAIYTNSMLEGSNDEDGSIPLEFALSQNYPNPFNPLTTISYQITEELNVTIEIYDITGAKIRTLVSSEMHQAGYCQVIWNATNDAGQPVSAGMYIYTIQAGEFRSTKKMLLLK